MNEISHFTTLAADTGQSQLWALFRQSFDLFTIVLLLGSLVGVAVIVRCLIDIRGARILPRTPINTIEDLVRSGRIDELRGFTSRDDSFVSRVVGAAIRSSTTDRIAQREAAELAASEEIAFWFRKIEPLNIIGNLGPLIGLAGTVWGMILAFTSLGESAGQAGPQDLSLGISKALFHTLLGLCLAIPCLLAFGWFRASIDRLCTRAMLVSAEIVERLPLREGKSG
jgi:biopolymer transport protein ExbB